MRGQKEAGNATLGNLSKRKQEECSLLAAFSACTSYVWPNVAISLSSTSLPCTFTHQMENAPNQVHLIHLWTELHCRTCHKPLVRLWILTMGSGVHSKPMNDGKQGSAAKG